MAVVKWKFRDIWGHNNATQKGVDTATYNHTLEINPNEGGSPQSEKNYNLLANAGPRHGIIVQEGRMAPPTIEFSGVILTRSQFEALDLWYRKRIYLRIEDDLGRYFRGSLAAFSPQRVRRPNNPWYHTYTASFNIVQATTAPPEGGGLREVIYGRTIDSQSTIRVRNSYTVAARASATSVLISRPDDVVEGDILICSMLNIQTDLNDGKPDGWTGFGSTNVEGGTDHRLYWKRATAREPASYRWRFTSAQKCQAVMIAVAGAAHAPNISPFLTVEHKPAIDSGFQEAPALAFDEVDSLVIIFGVRMGVGVEPPFILEPEGSPLATIRAEYREQFSQVIVSAPYHAGGPSHNYGIDWPGGGYIQTSGVAMTRDTTDA